MNALPGIATMTEQDGRITDVVAEQQPRLRNFIRKRVANAEDAEDLLQEVFSELVEANRLLMPIESVTGWLYQVARNRITDLFRKKKPESFWQAENDEGELLGIEAMLPSPDDGPEALYLRSALLDEMEAALAALPRAQREVFVAHELEGRSFRQLSEETGIGINTLLSRKRYAVLMLRKQLQGAYDQLTKK
jgi:RNA polymerase sigma factor (sigma-70 family)